MPPEAAFLKMTADQPVRAWEVIGVKGAMGVTAAIGIAAEDPTVLGFELIGSVDGGSLAFSPLARMAGGEGRSGVGELRPEKLYRADMSPLSRQISWLAMPLKPMPLKPPGTNPEECTVEVKKIERFFPEEEKKKPVELKLDKKGVSTLEVVPDEQIWLRFDLEVMIPANHSVSFFILKSFLILDKKDIEFKLPRTAFEFKPPSLNGELKGKQTLEFHLTVPKEVPVPKQGGEANMEPTVGKTLEITLAWSCHKGFEDVSNGTLAKLRLKVEKKK
jgi:hypothetical protein